SLSYEPPFRAHPDVAAVFRDAEGDGLLAPLNELMRPELATALRLTPREAGVVRSSVEALVTELRATTTPDARVASYDAAVKRLHLGMSEASYSRFMDFVEEHAARTLLNDAR